LGKVWSNKMETVYVKLHPKSRMRAAFFLATILTCGFGAIPWIIWEVVTRNQK